MEKLAENSIGVIFFVLFFVFFFWRKIYDTFLFIFIPEKREVEVLDVIYKRDFFSLPLDVNDNLDNRFDDRKKILDFFFYIKAWDERSGRFREVEVPPHVYKEIKEKIENSNSPIIFPCRKLAWIDEVFY